DVCVLFTYADSRFVLLDEELRERLAREAPDPVEVTLGNGIPFAGLIESLGGVLPDRFEEPKTSTRTSGNACQERAFHERLEEIDHTSAKDAVTGDDVLSRVRPKPPGEDSQASEHDLLVLIEEVIAPIECRSQGALALGRCSLAASKDRELVIEPVGEFSQREHAQLRGGKLEREPQPLDRSAALRDRLRS